MRDIEHLSFSPVGILVALAILGSLAVPIAASEDEPLEGLTVLVLAAAEDRAVLVPPGGDDFVVIGPGDLVPGTGVRVVEVRDDVLTLEEIDGGIGYWAYPPERLGERSWVRRVDRQVAMPPVSLPASELDPDALPEGVFVRRSSSLEPPVGHEAPDGETGSPADAPPDDPTGD